MFQLAWKRNIFFPLLSGWNHEYAYFSSSSVIFFFQPVFWMLLIILFHKISWYLIYASLLHEYLFSWTYAQGNEEWHFYSLCKFNTCICHKSICHHLFISAFASLELLSVIRREQMIPLERYESSHSGMIIRGPNPGFLRALQLELNP